MEVDIVIKRWNRQTDREDDEERMMEKMEKKVWGVKYKKQTDGKYCEKRVKSGKSKKTSDEEDGENRLMNMMDKTNYK